MQWASRAKNAGSKTALGKKVSKDDTTNQSVCDVRAASKSHSSKTSATCEEPSSVLSHSSPHHGYAIRAASPTSLDHADEVRQ
mmetsp:Transcript_7180/g.19667  ORF Transcript_7180/g.19667 Transcript_7180/m.19667 type:complete len:83 (-) Transcript_7180:180-428(-)